MSPAPPFLFLAQAALRGQPRYLVSQRVFIALAFTPLWSTWLAKRKRGVSRGGVAISFYLADAVLFGYRLARLLLEFVS